MGGRADPSRSRPPTEAWPELIAGGHMHGSASDVFLPGRTAEDQHAGYRGIDAERQASRLVGVARDGLGIRLKKKSRRLCCGGCADRMSRLNSLARRA